MDMPVQVRLEFGELNVEHGEGHTSLFGWCMAIAQGRDLFEQITSRIVLHFHNHDRVRNERPGLRVRSRFLLLQGGKLADIGKKHHFLFVHMGFELIVHRLDLVVDLHGLRIGVTMNTSDLGSVFHQHRHAFMYIAVVFLLDIVAQLPEGPIFDLRVGRRRLFIFDLEQCCKELVLVHFLVPAYLSKLLFSSATKINSE